MESVDPAKKVTVGIIGYGSYGKFFKHRFEEEGHTVICADKNPKTTGYSTEEVIEKSDVVMFCLPITEAANIMKGLKHHAHERQLWIDTSGQKSLQQLWLDITGLKTKVAQAMDDCECEFISIHPMCKPMDLKGQTIVVCDIKSDRWTKWFMTFLKHQRGIIRKSTPQEHDDYMAVVQGLPHSVLFAVAVTLYEKNVDIKETLKFTSPVYSIFMDLVGRFIYENHEMYVDMQIENREKIAPFLEQMSVTFANFKTLVAQGPASRERLVKVLRMTREHFGDDVVENMFRRSSDMIATLANFSEGNAVRIKTPPDEKGQLISLLEPFDRFNVNLLSIDSKKEIDSKTGERRTIFIIALGSALDTQKVQNALAEIKTLGFEILES